MKESIQTVVALILFAGMFFSSPGKSSAEDIIKLKPKHYQLNIQVDYTNQRMLGQCKLTVENSQAEPTQQIPFLLYRLMQVKSISDETGTPLSFRQQVLSFEDWPALQVNSITVSLDKPLKKGEKKTIIIEYEGLLLGYTETGMRYVQDRIDPEFTIIRPDCRAYPTLGVPSWKTNRKAGLPEFDYEINVTVPDTLLAANSGILIAKKFESGQVTYSYKSAQPGWRIDVPIALYGVLKRGNRQIFYFRKDSIRAKTIMQQIERTSNLYTDWFGPLRNQDNFTLIEIPDGWGSQTTAGCIIQSAGAFKDDQRLYELYHEISHLWNAASNDPYPPRWEEGLAMFLQYLTVEKLEHRPALAEASQRVINRLEKLYVKKPEYKNLALIDFGKKDATGLSYSAGMLFFHTLYSLVGEQEFLDIVGSFYQKYYASGATTEEFINHMKSNSGMDLTKLFNEWFYEPKYSQYFINGFAIDDVVKQYKENEK